MTGGGGLVAAAPSTMTGPIETKLGMRIHLDPRSVLVRSTSIQSQGQGANAADVRMEAP